MTPNPSTRSSIRCPGLALLVVVAALAAACGSDSGSRSGSGISLTVEALPPGALPAAGTSATFDVATWNLEWFGDTGNGPDDEDLQLANVRGVMEGLGIDLWAVQEVTSAAWFDTLVAGLEGYDGLLANDPLVSGGAAYYSDFDDSEQKVGLIYRSDLVRVDSARVILGGHDFDFAGRPPLELHLSITAAAAPGDLIVIVLHAKAGSGAEDRIRRRDGAEALHAYLNARYPDRRVLVTGDFNDDIDTSIAGGASPYAAFVGDPGYRFVTLPLSRAGASSTIFFSDMIDHQLVSDELAAEYVDGSADVYPADDILAAYAESTSDHRPVTARFGPGGVMPGTGAIGRSRLRWSGAATALVDVYRDGVLVGATPNDGRFLDEAPDAGGSSVSYRVCEAGSRVCSDPAPASF